MVGTYLPIFKVGAYSLWTGLQSETFWLGRLRSGGSVLTETSSGPRIGTTKVSSMIPMHVEKRNDKFKSENFLQFRPCTSDFLSYRQVSTSFVELSTLGKCGCDLRLQLKKVLGVRRPPERGGRLRRFRQPPTSSGAVIFKSLSDRRQISRVVCKIYIRTIADFWRRRSGVRSGGCKHRPDDEIVKRWRQLRISVGRDILLLAILVLIAQSTKDLILDTSLRIFIPVKISIFWQPPTHARG